MAPERFTNDEVTYRADVYALTCVLHECLTGAQPYQGDSVSVVITAHLMQPIPKPSEQRPGIPAAFETVIAKGMGKKPEDRYASAGDLAIAANDALSERDQDQAATILQRGPVRRRHQGELRAFPCPGSGIDSPTTWHYTDTPANVEGRIACGTYNNGPDLVWSKNADLLLVDIRPQVARHQGSITGALLIDPAAIADKITDRHREIVLCSVSSHRAIPAAEQLSRLGYDRVHYLAGGYNAWHRRATTR
jgi:rhodanese-related sulfurtransferase